MQNPILSLREKKNPFDELYCLFQRDIGCWRDHKMKMVGHHNELMEQEAALAAILLQNIEEQDSHFLRLENRTSAVSNGSDEKCPNFLWSLLHKERRG